MTNSTPPMDRFLDESVLADFTALRMTAFGKTVIDIANDPAFDTWTFSQKVLYALDKEVAARRDARRYLVPVGRYRVPTGADIGYRG